MKRRPHYHSMRGMTRAERAMGNTREDREMVANAATLPHGRHYRQALDDIDAGVKPTTVDTDKSK